MKYHWVVPVWPLFIHEKKGQNTRLLPLLDYKRCFEKLLIALQIYFMPDL